VRSERGTIADHRRTRGQVIASLAGILATVLMAIWVGASFVAERVTLHPKRWGVGPTPAQLGHAYQTSRSATTPG
jgi:hypothetical protein